MSEDLLQWLQVKVYTRDVGCDPTLNESIGLAAEIYEGSITDLPNPKAKKK